MKKENKEKDFWDKKAEKFYESKGHGDSSTNEFNILEKYEINDKKIIEIGIGNGKDLKKFSKFTKKLNGIDISKNMIGNFKKENPDLKVKLTVSDVRDFFKNAKNKYDIIYSKWSLMHLQYNEFKDLLNNVKDKMKEDGIFLISMRYGNILNKIHETTKLQSLQLNEDTITAAIENIEKLTLDSLKIFDVINGQGKQDKQITFVLKKGSK
ncbi:MAG: class I SAM-dependent methyltransferase [Mycoplasma sp.]|nr:class I SAM-dependent methyltransferase [Mycoplasma sp.]